MNAFFANANVVVCVATLLARAVCTSWKNASGGVNFHGLCFCKRLEALEDASYSPLKG